MTDMSNQIGVGRSWIVTVFAVCLGVLGLAFIFGPQEMAATILGRHDVEPIASMLGAALLGMGLMNWIARNSALGGIYGRTVVSGNQAHFLIGALSLLKYGAAVGGTAAYWVIVAFYVLGAMFFSSLLFGTGMRPPAGYQK
jgi:hypothetical protein